MSVTINGNGTITGYTPTSISGTLSGSNMPSGTILQTQKVTTTSSQQISANSTWTDTALTLNITPNFSNSLIFLTLHCRWGNTSSASNGLRLYKDSTTVVDGNNDFLHNAGYNLGGNRQVEDGSYAFFDTAGGTSQINYKVQCRVTNGHFTFNGRGGETNSPMTAYLIAQEIKV